MKLGVNTFRERRLTLASPLLAFSISLLVVFSAAQLSAVHVEVNAKGRRAVSPAATAVGPFGEIVRGPRGKSEIAITFDASAEVECFEDLIAALEKANVHSTFFITGAWAQKNRDCAAAIAKHGHEVGNHTWILISGSRQMVLCARRFPVLR
jgi:peptidoglycan/xylan/chitin deacetylase (PgdA/CDA1 family)